MKRKKNSIRKHFDAFGDYIIAGGIGGTIYALAFCLAVGIRNLNLLGVFFVIILGVGGGATAGLLEKFFKKPFFQSWAMVSVLLLLAPFLMMYVLGGFVYGYLFCLLWKARRQGLPDY